MVTVFYGRGYSNSYYFEKGQSVETWGPSIHWIKYYALQSTLPRLCLLSLRNLSAMKGLGTSISSKREWLKLFVKVEKCRGGGGKRREGCSHDMNVLNMFILRKILYLALI